MAYTFSPDQQNVIDSRNQNVLVSAAAGSGKTSVLTERIISRVLDENNPIDIDRILVVTFTKAAAREMKTRITESLAKRLACDPTNTHLQKQSGLIHNAQITTIDSFCLYIVKNNFHKIGLDPSFRIAGTGESELLLHDTLKSVIKDFYASQDEDFYHLVDCYGGKASDETIEDGVLKLYRLSMSYPWPKIWLEERRTDYEFESAKELGESALVHEIGEYMANSLEAILPVVSKVKEKCLIPGGPENYLDTVTEDYELIEKTAVAAKSADFTELSGLFPLAWPRLSTKKDGSAPELKEAVKKSRDEYKKAVSDIYGDMFNLSLETHFENIKGAGRVVNKLVDLTLAFLDAFEKAKRERGIVDFSDMEHMAVSILIKDYKADGSYEITDAAQNYRNFFEEVMVDEYQDSNLVQEIIIQSVSRENEDKGRNRFMVGDIKQSIYRFRLARPQIFLEKTDRYQKSPEAQDRLIVLKKNFRSRKAVVDSVNAVFERAMTKANSGMDYDDDERLYQGASYSEDTEANKTEVILLECEENAEERREREAELVAKRIREAVSKVPVTDKKTGELRRARYSDVAVLVRSQATWKDYIKDAFEKQMVPFKLEDAGSFFDTREIRDIVDFLKVLDNPLGDIALAGAMTSYFGNFSDEELARIKCGGGVSDYYLWEKFKTYCENNREDAKSNDFLSLILKYRKLVKVLPIQKLISTLLDETGYRNIVAALPDGARRLANVELLLFKASEYAKTSFYGLFHFLRYVELIKKLDSDEGEANIVDEDDDSVKVMTIHKSKGLEFPICVVLGIDEGFSTKDLQATFVNDIDAGIGAKLVDPERRIKQNTLRRINVENKVWHESVGEEIRILYVAMTRAREKLIMAGAVKNYAEWQEKGVPAGITSYLDAIRPALEADDGTVFALEGVGAIEDAAEEAGEIVERSLLKSELGKMSLEESETVANLKERFAFEYRFKNLSGLYTKTTVTELKNRREEDKEDESAHPFALPEREAYVPVFAGGDAEVKGTDRGTAYHNLMQLLDFTKFDGIRDFEAIKAEIATQKEAVVARSEMSAEDAQKVFDGKVASFFLKPISKRMCEAAKKGLLFKEQPFVMGLSADTLDKEFPKEETILVQGVIDVYFEEADGIVVLDYKTDRVEKAEELLERYSGQLEYYKSALEKLTGKTVKEELIYSFGLNELIVVK